MAFTSRLFMLLAIAIPTLTQIYRLPIYGPDRLPLLVDYNYVPIFPEAHRGDSLHSLALYVATNRDSCPPFGHPDNSYNVTVLGTKALKKGGCASMVPSDSDIEPTFNLWLGSPKIGGGKCGDENMDHYVFKCKVKYPFILERKLVGWYIFVSDLTDQWIERPNWICILYKIGNEDPPMIKMVISGNGESCDGLSERLEQLEQGVTEEESARIPDGSIALIFSRVGDNSLSPVLRNKWSEEQGKTMLL